MAIREKMTSEQKVFFYYGYAYRLAQEAKQDGCFPDMTDMQLCEMFIEELVIPKLEAKQKYEHLRRSVLKQ
ncbi:hypothetical protein BI001_gp203 [Bacillus phage Zuko]|uniref:hypothetical protein n=1 Tax=Bacillus phage Zuko TaxID=1805956 RepID=UPI0007A77085|nr:hypothetical protein BI001_gp203 [Bacillus phage Zuko]AMW62529.1 hypothetical protein ZUKO_175 [Bacillus phage Zuko]